MFRGRSGSLIKILWHDGVGMSLYAKRLERGPVSGKSRVAARLYRPILYSIVRGPVGPVSEDSAENYQRPRSVTIVFTPEALAHSDTTTAAGITTAPVKLLGERQ